jgi:ComF family protein
MPKSPERPATWSTPSLCVVCGRWCRYPVCEDCWALAGPDSLRCPRCASRAWVSGQRCRDCWPEGSALQATWAAVDYAYPWSGLIARFKFRGEVAWAPWLARAMWQTPGIEQHWESVDWLVPMPMAPQRLAERGYHPAWLLTQALLSTVSNTHQPIALVDGLVRLGHGEHQHNLPRAQRLVNPSLACVAHPKHASRWLGSHVLLIDDVCTTGASLEAAAQALRQAGAAKVSAWVLARTPPHHGDAPL